MRDRKDAVQEGCRIGGIQKRRKIGIQDRWGSRRGMQNKRYSGHEGGRKVWMQGRRDSGLEGYRTGKIHERRDFGLERYRKRRDTRKERRVQDMRDEEQILERGIQEWGVERKEGFRTGRIHEMINSGLEVFRAAGIHKRRETGQEGSGQE